MTTVSPFSLSYNMISLDCFGGAPGLALVIKLSGAACEGLVLVSPWEDTRFSIICLTTNVYIYVHIDIDIVNTADHPSGPWQYLKSWLRSQAK